MITLNIARDSGDTTPAAFDFEREALKGHLTRDAAGNTSSRTARQLRWAQGTILLLALAVLYLLFAPDSMQPAFRTAVSPSSTALFSSEFAQTHFDFDQLEVEHLLRSAQQPLPNIPKIVHFVHGLKEKDVRFTFIHYLAVKAAHDFIQPDAIYFHCLNTDQNSTNIWWQKAQSMITIKPARNVTKVFGHPVKHFAHKADVIRLESLLTWGGIYLDIDVITLKSFDNLLHYDAVLGLEQQSIPGSNPHGFGNGVILARHDSMFLREWYRMYRQFNSSQWATLSIHMPRQLAAVLPPTALHQLNERAFYTPCWDRVGKTMFYDRNDYSLDQNYAVHVWASEKQRVSGPQDICKLQNLFGRILRIAYEAGNHTDSKCPPGSMHNNPVPYVEPQQTPST